MHSLILHVSPFLLNHWAQALTSASPIKLISEPSNAPLLLLLLLLHRPTLSLDAHPCLLLPRFSKFWGCPVSKTQNQRKGRKVHSESYSHLSEHSHAVRYQQTRDQELKFLIQNYEKAEGEKGNLPG